MAGEWEKFKSLKEVWTGLGTDAGNNSWVGNGKRYHDFDDVLKFIKGETCIDVEDADGKIKTPDNLTLPKSPPPPPEYDNIKKTVKVRVSAGWDNPEYHEYAVEVMDVGWETVKTSKDKFIKFKSIPYRNEQIEALKFLRDSTSKYSFISAPTGIGKSLIGMCTMSCFQSEGVYLCSSKMLQTQMVNDFPEGVVLMGRNNYDCNAYDGLTAEDCVADCGSQCSYRDQKFKALGSRFPVLNYHYAIAEMLTAKKFATRNVFVCDEADSLPAIINSFVELRVSMDVLNRYSIGLPKYKTTEAKAGLDEVKIWARKVENRLQIEIKEAQKKLPDVSGTRDPLVLKIAAEVQRRISRLTSLRNKAIYIVHNINKDWIWGTSGRYFTCKPVWINADMYRKFLYDHGNKFIFMSATMPPKPILHKLFGLQKGEFDYLELSSAFDTERRKVYIQPIASITRDSSDAEMDAMVAEVGKIIDKYPNEKGIVHAVSFRLAAKIMQLNNKRLITHNSDDKMQKIENFVRSKQPLVMVSPSIQRGVDLHDDLCRFIIIPKCPFLDLGDPVTKRRAFQGTDGKLWYQAEAAQNIIQSAGRGMRHAEDFCETYVLDRKAEELMLRNPSLFPMWFRDAMELGK